MTIEQARDRVKALIQKLPEIAERVCVGQAQSGLSIVKNRSIKDGIFVNSEEGNFADYSKSKIPTSNFVGKERNQGGRDFIKNNPLGTWHDFRKAQGLNSEKVNASYSNRMWTSLAITQTARTRNGALVVVSTTDPNVRERLYKLFERYGNFLNPTEEEAKDLREDGLKQLMIEIKKEL